jgi:hypothetical protein
MNRLQRSAQCLMGMVGNSMTMLLLVTILFAITGCATRSGLCS